MSILLDGTNGITTPAETIATNLTSAIQEQQALITQLQADVATIKALSA
jgi:hypothetical protein